MNSREFEPCELLEWDTTFWGFPIARIRGDTLDHDSIGRIDGWCRRNVVRCLYFLARADHQTTTELAETSGFRLVDVRMGFRRGLQDATSPVENLALGPVVVRPSRQQDVATLCSIAGQNYRSTRFYYDPGFPRHLCDSLYETWTRVSCDGYAELVLVAELDGEPVGYITCHLDGEPRAGRIGLLGVHDGARDRGVGRALVLGALEWFRSQAVQAVFVVTQGRNCAAQRLFQRCGFLTASVQLWYHKWYRSSGEGR